MLCAYSGTALVWTLLGQKLFMSCPDFRDCGTQGGWDCKMCPVYRGILISGRPDYALHMVYALYVYMYKYVSVIMFYAQFCTGSPEKKKKKRGSKSKRRSKESKESKEPSVPPVDRSSEPRVNHEAGEGVVNGIVSGPEKEGADMTDGEKKGGRGGERGRGEEGGGREREYYNTSHVYIYTMYVPLILTAAMCTVYISTRIYNLCNE